MDYPSHYPPFRKKKTRFNDKILSLTSSTHNNTDIQGPWCTAATSNILVHKYRHTQRYI